jgi:hypothetical protein
MLSTKDKSKESRINNMYKIKVINLESQKVFWEYGFGSYLMKRIQFMYNERNINGSPVYEILEVFKINFSLKTFARCLTNKCYMG